MSSEDQEEYPPKPRPLWFYPKDEWQPAWWHKWGVPSRGGDEWGRRTVVIGTGLTGYICVVWRTCWCQECHWGRSETYQYAKAALDKHMDDYMGIGNSEKEKNSSEQN